MIDIKIKYWISRFALFIIILSSSQNAFGQPENQSIENIKIKELKGLAKNSLRLGDGYTALYYYKEWALRRPKNLDITYQVAELYRYTRNYKEAESWYSKLAKSQTEKFPLSVFYLARVQMAQEKYTQAKSNYLIFKKLLKKIDDIYFRDQCKKGILSCDFALDNKNTNPEAIINHLDKSINKPHIEFSPILLDENTLLYGSLKVDGMNYYNIDTKDSLPMPLRKFYLAKKVDDKWIGKREFYGPINSEEFHAGNAAIADNGEKLFFTICQKNWKNDMICDLYYSEKDGSNWSKAVKMNESINLPYATTSQPTIGYESKRNAEVIYFVSDRPGGKGGLDIWYTEYNARKKTYRSPRNAGSKINSRGDEMTPYYNRSTHTLFYSSNGKIGYGGLDVFKSAGEKKNWENSEILGKGINTSYDDLDFTLNHEKSGGFIVSNRPGGTSLLSETCCDDIYEFKYSKFIKIDFEGKVKDKKLDLEDYNVALYLKDTVSGKRFLAKELSGKESEFSINLEQGFEYEIEVSKKGYFSELISVNTTNTNESTVLNKIVNLEKIPNQPIVLEGILYGFDSDKLTKDAKTTIDTTLLIILNQNKNIVIQISSHTDSKGKESYNLDLSKRRARSVVNYLTFKGIPSYRLEYKGYGESKPIAPNTKPDGSDNPAGRKLNRRTEFSIIEELSEEEMYQKNNKINKNNQSKSKRKKSKASF